MATGAVLGAVCGALMVGAALDHNPQNAYVDTATGHVAYLGLAMIFLSWFALTVFAALFAFFGWSALQALRRRIAK
jgi:hypothetical protein